MIDRGRWNVTLAIEKRRPLTQRSGKFLLVDGTAFCYRAFYAIKALTTSSGRPTNAIYGFITMLKKLVDSEQPGYLAICFDRKEPTFRHKEYKEYKAHRKPMPDDLVSQLEPIKDFCRAYGYAIFEKPGFEADDLIGTIARKAEEEGLDVFIVTGDKDAMQLVNDKIKILNPHKENIIYDRAGVRKRFDGLGPEKVLDVMALMGDASDNIPGVPGIGEKTALKLIKEFGSVENLLERAGNVKSKSQQALLKEHKEKALLSKKLARIDTEVDVDLSWEEIALREPDEKKLEALLKEYEFRTLLKGLAPGAGEDKAKRRYEIIRSEKELTAFAAELKKKERFSFDTETTSSDAMRANLVGMSFCSEPYRAVYIPVSSKKHKGEGLPLEKVLAALKSSLENPKQKKIGQNIKYDWMVMKRHGITLEGLDFDTMIASHLIQPAKPNHNLDDIAFEHLGVRKIPTEDLLGKGKTQITMDEVEIGKIAEYASEDADCVFRLYPILVKKLKEMGLTELFKEVEMPLLSVLAKVEMNGVALNVPFLNKLSAKAGDEMEKLTRDIYKEAGEEFNINSTKQLAEVLFVKMKIPTGKKTKTGFSTDVGVLEKLAEDYKLPKMILEYREKAKLKSTYLDALPELIHPETGCVHTSYHQATTATGRLSSSDPNLQNIPVRSDAGREVRKAFIARKEKGRKGRILSADYSQIELRILAHLSEDPNLTKAFKEDRDIHNFTATLLYGVSEDAVTRQMRDVAKVINFSIIYGKSAFGLSRDLAIPIAEADHFIREYFNRYSGVRDYMESQKEKARKQGYLTTILDRRAYFPEINASNMMRRQFAERAAINAPIQGSAADLIKIAMIAIQNRLEEEFKTTYMIMQVHDELVFDVPEQDLEKVSEMIREEMESAYRLKVPLKADIHIGESWCKN